MLAFKSLTTTLISLDRHMLYISYIFWWNVSSFISTFSSVAAFVVIKLRLRNYISILKCKLNRRLCGHQSRSGRVEKILRPPGFKPRTFHSVASRYINYANPAHCFILQIHILLSTALKSITFLFKALTTTNATWTVWFHLLYHCKCVCVMSIMSSPCHLVVCNAII